MRPIADPIGVMDRLSWDRVSREERLAAEATLNRRESRAALVFAGLWLFLIPFGLGYFFSRGVAEPVVYFTQVRPYWPPAQRSPPSAAGLHILVFPLHALLCFAMMQQGCE